MEQYIRKSAIVAEIERRINNLGLTLNEKEFAVKYELKDVLSFLDSLKVKEVDLNKEFGNYTKDILACDVQFEPFTHLYNCAKHFYELGLNAHKGK